MTLQYANAAEKNLVNAVPTLNADGNVIKWDIEIEYSLNDYASKYSKLVDVEPTKAPTSYTKAEVMALADMAHLDMVFDSQYESVKVAQPAAETKVSDFDINTLG